MIISKQININFYFIYTQQLQHDGHQHQQHQHYNNRQCGLNELVGREPHLIDTRATKHSCEPENFYSSLATNKIKLKDFKGFWFIEIIKKNFSHCPEYLQIKKKKTLLHFGEGKFTQLECSASVPMRGTNK